MELMKAFRAVALGAAVVAGVGGVAVGVTYLNENVYTVQNGEQYLKSEGYSNVSGGETSYFNTCGKHVYARKFEVTNPKDGQRETRTVCYSPLFGTYSPLIGK